jgi:RNA polymerase sigma-70 factor (ECF subfamily)
MPGERQLDPAALGDHIDRLYRAAWAMCGSREDAEDLVQETFANVLRRPRLLRSGDEVGYLLRALRNTFVSERRARARRPRSSPGLEELELREDPRAPRPEALLESERLYAAIAALPAEFRDALVAIDLVGLSYAEAARALKVQEATVATRLHRARRRLARTLRDPEERGRGLSSCSDRAAAP